MAHIYSAKGLIKYLTQNDVSLEALKTLSESSMANSASLAFALQNLTERPIIDFVEAFFKAQGPESLLELQYELKHLT